ncbi:MAG: hypothetical protein JJ866_19345 [Roseibium sp.]|uniref:hypothetical protein n=1 Tax=Roseibium sp. TaxID=1936156 RepID=UPI001B263ACA|nr:hypothetical protein [Roseibium sp.]MBO6894105.1 hypothetical protein [Roseibium sp.]MBO6929691.1 hypothetical protein [Roseibium sp.]
MMEPRSNATIKALASLAELSANQLEEGVSVEEVIATLRKAAETVREVVEADETIEDEASDGDLAQDLTPLQFPEDVAAKSDEETDEEPVLNAG